MDQCIDEFIADCAVGSLGVVGEGGLLCVPLNSIFLVLSLLFVLYFCLPRDEQFSSANLL